MTHPERPKRPSARPSARSQPSARPSARPTAPPPAAKSPTETTPSPTSARPSAEAATTLLPPLGTSETQATKARGQRVSARRSVPTPGSAVFQPEDRATTPVKSASSKSATSEKAPRTPSAPKAKKNPSAEAVANRAGREVKAKSDPARRGAQVASPIEAKPSVAPPGITPIEADESWNAVAAPTMVDVPQRPSARPDAELLPEARAAQLLRGDMLDARTERAEHMAAQSLLSSDYYARQYGAHGLRSLAADVDEFGFDPHVEERTRPMLERLARQYFRVSIDGAHRLPNDGRALCVANRSGTVPWDALMLRTMLRTERPELPPLRWLAEDTVIHLPFLGVLMNRLGAVRACPENAERLLQRDRLVAVFPEGAQGSRKLFGERYRLQRFGRGGYIRLSLKLGVPIFPTAIVGAEDAHPLLGRSRALGRIFGAEYVPFTPTFPWLGALGLVPAPVKWRIVIGEPVDLSGYGPKAADDALVVHRLNEQVRGLVQGLVDQAREKRGHPLFG